MQSNITLTQVYQVLYQFGLTADSAGFFYLSYAVYLSIRQPDRMVFPSRWILPEIARHYQTTPFSVLHEIQSAISQQKNSFELSFLYRALASGKAA